MAGVSVPQIADMKPVGADIKPIGNMGLAGMSLGDVANMAATVQAFQKQKELMPYQIETTKAQSESQQLQTASQKQQAIGASFVSRINNPLIVAAEANPNAVDRQALAKSMEEWGQQQGKDLGLDKETTARLSQPYIQMALENPAQLRQYLKERHIAGLDQGARTQAAGIMPQLTTAGGQPALFNPATGEITQPQVVGGQPMGMAPQGQPTGVTPQQMGQPYGGGQQQPAMRLNFPVRPAGDVRPIAPGEAEEAIQGQKYLSGLADFGVQSVKYKNDVDNVIKQAEKIEKEAMFTSGLAGAGYRKVAQWLGDESYIQLNKDLANVQLQALKASGADLQTDTGKKLQAMANGDASFPPDVLINIANRTKAEITNVDLQRQAAARFNQRYPGYANFGVFKQAWGDNADSQVFQMMNAEKEIKDPAKLNSTFAKIMELPSDPSKYTEEQRQKAAELMTKYRNIKKLVGTGAL